MLDAGLDPNIVGVFRRGLILPLAASLNYASAVSVLITAGLNPDGRTGDGLSALDHAARGAEASLALNVCAISSADCKAPDWRIRLTAGTAQAPTRRQSPAWRAESRRESGRHRGE